MEAYLHRDGRLTPLQPPAAAAAAEVSAPLEVLAAWHQVEEGPREAENLRELQEVVATSEGVLA